MHLIEGTGHDLTSRYCSGLDEEFHPAAIDAALPDDRIAARRASLVRVREAMRAINAAAGARIGHGQCFASEIQARARLHALGLDEMMAKLARSYGYIFEPHELDEIAERIDNLSERLDVACHEAKRAA